MNKDVVKWIGIIMAVLITVGGWAWGGLQTAATERIHSIKARLILVESLVLELKIGYSVILEKLSSLGDKMDRLEVRYESD